MADASDHRERLRRALTAITQLRAENEVLKRAACEPIATIGVGCRFPCADDPDAYWSMLSEGREGIVSIPCDRWDIDALYDPHPEAPGKMYVRQGGFLRDLDRFDARFFGIPPREAACMDPQQRLLLEVTWETLERAGHSPATLVGSDTGVFVGITFTDYHLRLIRNGLADVTAHHLTGNALNFAAGRLAFTLGLQGPCVAIDTACSSSLVAVHLAVQALQRRECRMAIAAGVNVMIEPEWTITACKAGMLSPDSRCKTFDAAANGYVRSEGCGVVLLTRLGEAVADRDHVVAVVRGTAVNQNGRSSGL